MIHLHHAGDSLVHRMPAGAKLGAFGVLALFLSVVPQTGWTGAGILAVVVALYAAARLPPRVLLAEVWRLRWIAVVLAAALWIFVSPAAAWVGLARVVALLLLAALLTITTPMGDLLGVLRRALEPLRRAGVDPDAVALTVSLTITMIPVVAGFALQMRDAQRARGVRLGVLVVVPLMVRTLRHADEVGDALAARGLG